MLNECKEILLSGYQIVSMESGYVYYLQEGTLQLWELHNDGVEILINVLKPDDAVRLPDPSINSVYEFRTNKEKAQLILYKWDSLHKIEEKYYLLNKVATTTMRTELINHIKRKKFVKNRLVYLLQFLSQEFGEIENQYYILNIPLTHEHLSSLILSSRVTVTKLLNELKKQKVITNVQGFLYIRKDLIDRVGSYDCSLEVV